MHLERRSGPTPWVGARPAANPESEPPAEQIEVKSEIPLKNMTFERRDETTDFIPPHRIGNSAKDGPVAVIGGSAAGLFTSSLLAKHGVPVRVFEHAETMEPSARTLIVTQRMRSLLGRAAEGCIV